MILDKKPTITKKDYFRIYNNLINLVNGRSYKVYLNRKDLLNEVLELHNQYKDES